MQKGLLIVISGASGTEQRDVASSVRAKPPDNSDVVAAFVSYASLIIFTEKI